MREPLTENEALLLLSAAYWQSGDNNLDNNFYPTLYILNLVLHWKGMNKEEIDFGWRNTENLPASHLSVFNSLVDRVYQITRNGNLRPPRKKTGEVLFIGKGNWGIPDDVNKPPADPMYTQIQLSASGLEMARLLLAENPKLAPLMKTEIAHTPPKDTDYMSLSGNSSQFLELHLYEGTLAAGIILDKLNLLKERAIAEINQGKRVSELSVKLQSDLHGLRFLTTSYPCIYTINWTDWRSPGTFFVKYFKNLNLKNYYYFFLWHFGSELCFVDMSQNLTEMDDEKKHKEFEKEERWFINRFYEAAELAKLNTKKSVLIFKRYYMGPAQTPEFISKSSRKIPKWIKDLTKNP
ncbi:MAG: hypothetical protein ACKOS8_12580 [Gemmataceae bacterium]